MEIAIIKSESDLNLLAEAGFDTCSCKSLLLMLMISFSDGDTCAEKISALKNTGLVSDEALSKTDSVLLEKVISCDRSPQFSEFILAFLPDLYSLFLEIGRLCGEHNNRNVCVAMYLFACCRTEIDSFNTAELEKWYEENNPFRRFWEEELSLKFSDFLMCFSRYLLKKCENIKVISKGKIKKALEIYRRFSMPNSKLFIDYCAASGLSGNPYNPWAEFKTNAGINIKPGTSLDESAFNDAAWAIRNEKATDVIRNLFYPSYINDSGFEIGFLVPEFFEKIHNEKCYVYNPSPDMILEIINRYGNKDVTYIVADHNVCTSYQKQFPGKSFVAFEESSCSNADCILFVLGQWSFSTLTAILSQIQQEAIKTVTLFASNGTLDDLIKLSDSNLFESVSFDRILLLEAALTRSEPRKKCVIYLKKKQDADEKILFQYAEDIEGLYLLISDNRYFLCKDDLGLSLKRVWNKCCEQHKHKQNNDEVSRRKKALIYHFSNEILIHYKIINRKKTGAVAAVSYWSFPVEKHKSHKVSRDIEKGMKYTDQKELLKKLEAAVFEDDLYTIITDDIKTAFIERYTDLSLKSLWFVEREELLRQDKYDDDLAKSVFCKGNSLIENLTYNTFNTSDFRSIMSELTEGMTREAGGKIWEQINLIFCVGVDNNHLPFNPVASLISEVRKTISEEQQEVRNALTKKHFSIQEQKKLLIDEEVTEKNTWTNSNDFKTLIICFRLFTGIQPREMSALKWSDIKYCKDYGFYQVQITKFWSKDGKHNVYGEKEDWKKFRLIPVVKELYRLLHSRKNAIQKKYGISDEMIEEMPVFCEKMASMKKSQQALPPWKITEICRNRIGELKISSLLLTLPGKKEYVTDLSKYRNDIFISNFKYHANHTALMTRGEINYVLGVSAPDTYSQHYCDYTNDAIQYSIYKKIERWVMRLLPEISCKEKGYSNMIVSGPYNKSSVVLMEMEFTAATDIILTIDCENGFDLNVNVDQLEEKNE